ncbi:putative RING finger protein C16G5.03 [Psilocybe cubensis]|uniref:RING finger protein C16G5.03 n=2 Tax=Psilocybe cubensis TaxID=181762 RepID=A0ACB8GH68_PSICU|nr:putative RING finger protein C16G5.03 [Psilocybe cubensis]KAH9475038.1 putative RING finger protein C16G5.03 [Psilocybe cubensis]
MTRPTSPPAAKRIKLEERTPTHLDVEPNEIQGNDSEVADINEDDAVEDEEDENNCSICLHSVVDRTVIPKCSHEFCFECLLMWAEQSRRCPLCSQAIGDYLIHSIRSRYDYRKHYLSPLRTSPPPSRPAQATNAVLRTTRQNARRRREREWGTRVREHEEFDKLERSILKRRWIYQHDLYAKHVASNSYTKYRPYPTPSQFSNSQELISRTTSFLRRELQVWEGLDVEFLTNLIISLMKAIDIRSESAVKLISEFLDMDEPYTPGGRHVNAEHFAHEVYCYVRSPYRDLFVYDTVVQYDLPAGVPPPPDLERSRRWHPSSPPRSTAGPSQENRTQRLRSRTRSSERECSWSPSGRQYPSTRNRITFDTPGASASKYAEHGSHIRTRNVNLQDKGRSSISDDEISHDGANETWEKDVPIASSSKSTVFSSAASSSRNVKHMPIVGADDYRTKGKGKADAKEYPKAAIELANDISESANTPDAEEIDQDLGHDPPDGKHMPNDVFEDVDPKPVPSRPTRTRALRPPRNSSLRDSVKAHLAKNAETWTGAADSTKVQPTRQPSTNETAPPMSASTEFPPASLDHTDIPPASNTQAQSLSVERQAGTRFVDISRADARGSNASTRDTRVGIGHPKISDPFRSSTEIPRTNIVSDAMSARLPTNIVQEDSVDRTLEPNARNDAANSPLKVITDVHGESSSSNINRPQNSNHGMCAADTISLNAAVPSSKFSPKISGGRISPMANTNHGRHSTCAVDGSVQRLASSDHAQKVHRDHDVQADPEIPGMEYIPIRKDGCTNTDSITLVNHSTVPRAIKTTRTRLLARLEFEKQLAAGCPGIQDDTDPRALRDGMPVSSTAVTPASSSFDASAVHMDAPLGDISDAPHRPDASAQSLKDNSYANTDPGPEHPEEEANVREARLRARIQLRARLAAEKRKASGY